MTRNNASLMYVNFTGIEISNNVQVGTSTADSNGSWVLGLQNAYFSQSSKYISHYSADPTSYIMIESFGYNVIKCKLAKQDNSAAVIELYNCNNTSFENDINITPTQNCIIKNCTFTSSKSFSIVATKNLYIDANSYKQLEAATETLTGMTIVPLDGVLPTSTTIDLIGKWSINASNTLIPATDNSSDIGNGLVNPRDIAASRKQQLYPHITAGRTSAISRTFKMVTHTLTNAQTNVIATQVPAGAKIISCQLNNDTLIAGVDDATGAVPIASYNSAYSTGSTQAISTGTLVAQNTKVNKFFDVNAATDITTGLTDVTVDSGVGNKFTAGGIISCVVVYEELTSITNA